MQGSCNRGGGNEGSSTGLLGPKFDAALDEEDNERRADEGEEEGGEEGEVVEQVEQAEGKEAEGAAQEEPKAAVMTTVDDDDEEEDEDDEEDERHPYSMAETAFSMANCRVFSVPPPAFPDRSIARRLLDARRSLCYLPIAQQPLGRFDDDTEQRSALDVMRRALGCVDAAAASRAAGSAGKSMAMAARASGGETPDVATAAHALPPLAVLLDQCLAVPVRARCSAPGPLLLAAVSGHFQPLEAASLMHRVLLFAEPRLTAPLFEGLLFQRLQAEHRTWRRQLPELHACLVDSLLTADLSPEAVRCFSLELRAAALPPAAGTAAGEADSSASTAAALDATDVGALSLLRLHFCARWPLAFVLSETALEAHEAVFQLLLRLRRARWALETADAEGAERRRMQAGLGSGGGASEARERFSSHPWRVLRAEVLHLIASIYSHLTLGVINPEWRAFVEALAESTHVDAFRRVHEGFARRVFERCLLAPCDAPLRRAIDRILALALRLRVQLDSLPRIGAEAHTASATKWRRELRESVRFVLNALRTAGEQQSRVELLDLCRLLSFNEYYSAV